MADFNGHRPGGLKQQNKGHKGRHSKRYYKREGRVDVTKPTSGRRNMLHKDARRLKAKQQRDQKSQDALQRKRQIGTDLAPPCLVVLVPMTGNTDCMSLRSALVQYGAGEGAPQDPGLQEAARPVTFYSEKLKQRASFVVAPVEDVFGFLELAKVADVIVCVWGAGEHITEAAATCVTCLMHQGLPAVAQVLQTDGSLGKKAHVKARALAQQQAQSFFPEVKLLNMSRDADCQPLLWCVLPLA